ncbi:hypothetical protein ACT7C9_29690 [Bacillus cereus]
MKPPTILAAEAGLSKKRRWLAQKGEGIGTPDEEAFCASQEGVK